MVYNPDYVVTDLAGEILTAIGGVGIVKPQCLPQWGETVAGNGPVGNLIVYGLRAHIVNVLGVIPAAYHFFYAGELVRLEDDVADAAPADACILPAGNVNPIHHNTCHRPHSVISFAASLTLNKPGQELSV